MYERFTDRARKVMQLANQEARNLNHNYVGTEHLLLGLLREQEGAAARVLMNLGLKLEDVRSNVLHLLGHDSSNAEHAFRMSQLWIPVTEGLPDPDDERMFWVTVPSLVDGAPPEVKKWPAEAINQDCLAWMPCGEAPEPYVPPEPEKRRRYLYADAAEECWYEYEVGRPPALGTPVALELLPGDPDIDACRELLEWMDEHPEEWFCVELRDLLVKCWSTTDER